ncbi:MAG: AsmA family protein [Alphaproteobacteria bacterium]|nr:AsmA family protein [Alphaproteobacteria bacterium]
MKTFLKISAGLFFVVILALSGVYMGRNKLIKDAVEKIGPKFTQTTVLLGEIDFQPFQGHLMLKELHIGNPEGFSGKDLFSLGKITVDLQPKTVFSNKIIINQITVDNVFASYEIANGTNNIAALQKNIAGEPKTADTTAAPDPAKNEKGKQAKQVVIKDLTVKDAKVSASISGIGMTLPLPTIHMTDIGEKKPSTFKEVLTSVINVFSTETLNAIATATTEAVKSGTDSIGKLLKKLF